MPLNERQFTGQETVLFYDEHARRFMGPVFRSFTKELAGLKPAGNRVLDIGTGSGMLAVEIAKARPDYYITGIDISPDMLNHARENVNKAGLSGRIGFKEASADDLPFPDGSFDIVVSNASLHLWADPLKVFMEMARVTAAGGCCLIWDNLRVPVLYPLLNIAAVFMGMSKEQRRLWLNAVRSSYTAGEVISLLNNNTFKNARVTVNPFLLELRIRWQKPVK